VKGAFLVAEDADLYRNVRDALVRVGAVATDDDVVQFRDELGNLLTVFGRVPMSTDWEWREGPLTIHGTIPLPSLERATACWLECRSERAFAVIVRQLATELAGPAWVIDGDGGLWLASKVDPDRLKL